MADFALLLHEAQILLARTLGGEVLLGTPQRLTEEDRRSLVLRIPIWQGLPGAPETVILKGSNLPAVPEADQPASILGFFTDWAGSCFLDDLGGGHGPRFYGGSRKSKFILLEDFGDLPDMVKPLVEETGSDAEGALMRYMVRLGQMHAQSAGKESRFMEIARQISPAEALLRNAILERAGKLLERLEVNADRYGLSITGEIRREIQTVLETAIHPEPFLAYVHNDSCPDNLYDDGQKIRLFDFEFSGFGHALLDAVYPRMSFPSCWCANRVPRELVARLERRYREELVQGIPEAADDVLFGRAITAACAFWLLVDLGFRLKLAESHPDGMWGLATVPSRLATRTQAFACTAEEFGCFQTLGTFALRFKEKLAEAWPEYEGLPEFPAFRS